MAGQELGEKTVLLDGALVVRPVRQMFVRAALVLYFNRRGRACQADLLWLGEDECTLSMPEGAWFEGTMAGVAGQLAEWMGLSTISEESVHRMLQIGEDEVRRTWLAKFV